MQQNCTAIYTILKLLRMYMYSLYTIYMHTYTFIRKQTHIGCVMLTLPYNNIHKILPPIYQYFFPEFSSFQMCNLNSEYVLGKNLFTKHFRNRDEFPCSGRGALNSQSNLQSTNIGSMFKRFAIVMFLSTVPTISFHRTFNQKIHRTETRTHNGEQ